ncbi:uncharacterized protein [Periplaneta americana]|uniref:uncharacterized protein n=1 Tax=Periplaneta americana TaxID=6978 RepID=UPI0037E70E6D
MCRACLPPLPHPSMCERCPPRPPQQKSVSRTCEHGAMPALDKPRVIAEVRKSVGSVGGGALLGGKPRISGEMRVIGIDGSLGLRHLEVRDGCLLVQGDPGLRLPLRHLSLQRAARCDRTFSLVRDQRSILTLQAGTDEQYARWVKALAVEVMRQTPLDAVRFLDILGILQERGRSRTKERTPAPAADEVAALLRACQRADRYVPVREKRRLFESLGRAQSSEDLRSGRLEGTARRSKRARSCHDLSRCGAVAVREICRYFETRAAQPPASPTSPTPRAANTELGNAFLNRRRVQRGERRLARLKQQAAECEEAIWRLQNEMAALDCSNGDVDHRAQLYAVLEQRLVEQETQLSRLQDDANRTLKEVELAADKFETALVQEQDSLKT